MAVADYPHFYPSYYTYPEFSQSCIIIYCQSQFYQQYMRTTSFSVANHNTECKKVPNCKYHVMIIAKDLNTILTRFENAFFLFQEVDDIYYTFKTFMVERFIVQGSTFNKLVDALEYSKIIQGYERNRSVHTKRIRRKIIRVHKNKLMSDKTTQTGYELENYVRVTDNSNNVKMA